MSVFKVGQTVGAFDHLGAVEVSVVGQVTQGKRDPFHVCMSHTAGASSFGFYLTPEQSRDLRRALEDAEAKAEILTAAI